MRLLVMLAALLAVSLPAHSAWRTEVSKDEMTGKPEAYAYSQRVRSTKPMRWPYQGTRAWLGVGCDGKDEWVYVGFTNEPNLNNTGIEDGYHTIRTRVKWDDSVETTSLSQDWGASFIHFRNDTEAVRRIIAGSSMLLELDWHGNGRTYFRFSLAGSSAALEKIRKACAR